jgi:hypothetical protein
MQQTLVGHAVQQHLRGLTGLRKLRLFDTRVTDQGIAELRKALPELRVTR